MARHDGRVVFVRYALPGERVRVRVTADRGSYWHAEAVEVIEPSDDRRASLCPIAGVEGAGCCDLAFVEPTAARALKAEVVSNQLARLGNYQWSGVVEPLSPVGPTGWRTRVRLDVGADGRRRISSLPQRRAGRRSQLRSAAGRDDRRSCLHRVAARRAAARRHRRRRSTACGAHGATGPTNLDRGGRGQLPGRAAGGSAQLAGTGDGFLAGPSRRSTDLQRTGGRLGSTGPGHDRLGSLRWRRGFRRGAR